MERLFFSLSFFSFLIFVFFLAGSLGAFRRIQGFLKRLLPFLLALVFLTGSLATGMVALGFRYYAQLDREELVAVVQCERAFQKESDYTLLYTPVVYRQGWAKTQAFPMRGNEWAFGGTVLRWKGWMRLLGARTLYRPRSIQAIPGFATPHSLENGFDPIWFVLKRTGSSLPFVESSYVSWVSSPVEYGVQFRIYVTPTGFSVKKVVTHFSDIS